MAGDALSEAQQNRGPTNMPLSHLLAIIFLPDKLNFHSHRMITTETDELEKGSIL